MKIFISGSISIKSLPQLAIEKIDNIILKNYSILIGDANGVDSQVQKYLYNKNYKNVMVYYTGENIRNNIGSWKSINITSDKKNLKGRAFYTVKDIAMAKEADYGLMIWDGKSQGTLNNINEMKKENKRFYIILNEKLIDDKNIENIKPTALAV